MISDIGHVQVGVSFSFECTKDWKDIFGLTVSFPFRKVSSRLSLVLHVLLELLVPFLPFVVSRFAAV